MKKTFYLSYEFWGEQRDLQFDNLFDFIKKLDNVFDKEGVNQDSITFRTEEVKEEAEG